MAGRFKLDINETEGELKALLGRQTTARGKERVQALYLLKGGKVQTVSELASFLGRHRVTVQDWLALYRDGGMQALLHQKRPTGRKSSIPPWAVRALKKRLQESQNFESYKAIHQWLKEQGVNASYAAVYRLLRKLKIKSKMTKQRRRRVSEKLKRFNTYLDDRELSYWLLICVGQFRQKLRYLLKGWIIQFVKNLVGEDIIFEDISVALIAQKILPVINLSRGRLAPIAAISSLCR